MKGSSYIVDTHKFSSLTIANHIPLIHSQSTLSPRNVSFRVSNTWPKSNHAANVVKYQKGESRFVVECAKWSLVKELEGEIEAEMKPEEGNEEKGKSGMGRYKEKCEERKGIVELLECLEKEAIMGEDMGKEPMDYNRRAMIFDKSSRVFQALKELDDHDHDFPQQSS